MTQLRHKVHVYAIVRVEFWVDGAGTPAEAARRVIQDPATHERLHELRGEDHEYAEDYEDKVVVDTYEGDELVAFDEVDVSDTEEKP